MRLTSVSKKVVLKHNAADDDHEKRGKATIPTL